MIIKFNEDAVDSYINTLNKLKDLMIVGEFTNPGYPVDCVILKADDEGLTICEYDLDGEPISNSTWLVGYDEIRSVTVI